jgi:hypothetical protein
MKTTTLQDLLYLGSCASVGVGLAALFAGCVAPGPEMFTELYTSYHYPLMSPGAQFAELPPSVQRTIRAQTGGAPIANIEKDTRKEQVVYRIYFENPASYPTLYVAPDGSVLNPDLTVAIAAPHEVVATKTAGLADRITLQDLPPSVLKAIQSQAPDAEVSTITRETHGDKVVYVVTFKDRMHATMYLASDGTLLHEGGH